MALKPKIHRFSQSAGKTIECELHLTGPTLAF